MAPGQRICDDLRLAGTVIVFSDTHLTERFNTRKFNYLKEIITQADRIIINGDLWDGFICSFDEFVKSEWRKLFPLLKSKGTIYLHGNHDPKKWCDERVALFSICQLNSLDLKVAGIRLHIEHGHRISPKLVSRLPCWQTLVLALRPLIGNLNLSLFRLWLATHRKRFLAMRSALQSKAMKRWCRKNLRENQMGVFGHSHAPELDYESKFISTGFINFGYASCLKIIGGRLILVEERY